MSNGEILYVDISKSSQVIALKQIRNDKMCMAVSAAMAFNTTPENFADFMKDVSIRFKNINTEPGYGYLELKIFALAHNKDIKIVHGNPEGEQGPAVIVVHSERHKNVLHAIYCDSDSKLHDPNPDTNDGRDISTYKVVEWYKIIPLVDN